MGFEGLEIRLRQGKLPFQTGNLPLQPFPLPKCLLQLPQLLFRLGQKPRLIEAAFVFQLLELPGEGRLVNPLVAGGDQGVEPGPQSLALGHGHLLLPDKPGPAEYLPLHPQKGLAAVVRRQLRHRQPGLRLVGPEDPHGDAALGGPLQGDASAVPVESHGAGHGASGPGGIALLGGKGLPCGFGPGIQAIEHGKQEGAPGALAPFVLPGEDIEPRGEFQGPVLQRSEGRRHGFNSHGSATSSPSKSLAASSAAR